MGARRTARERALQALYQLDLTDGQPEEALESVWAAANGHQIPEPDAERFAQLLVKGVREHLEQIDELIQAHSHHWRLDRMTRIDRNVLRMGIFELKYLPDVPHKVSINEAVELGKRFGTEESSAFINGLLDRIATSLGKT